MHTNILDAQLRAYISNSAPQLLAYLSEDIFSLSSPERLPSKNIVVPSQAMQEYIQKELVSYSPSKVLFGVRFLYLNEALKRMQGGVSKSLLSFDEIASRLYHYFVKYPERIPVGQCQEKGIEAFCLRLAKLFSYYHRFGKKMLMHWVSKGSQNFQSEVWLDLFSEEIERIEAFAYQSNEQVDEEEWYFFGWNFLPEITQNFLKESSKTQKISIYALSPCKLFWLDTPSYLEQFAQRKRWERLEMDEQEMEYAESLIEDVHPLLLSSGSMGKHFLDWVEESSIVYKGYQVSAFCAEDPFYEDLFFETESTCLNKQQPSILNKLQSDILVMKERKEISDVANASIEVHVAHSKYREVQIVYDKVVELIQSNDDLQLDDFHICAPVISDYYNEIHAVFGDKESVYPYHILDPNWDLENEVLASIMLWGNLLQNGKAEDIYSLIRNRIVCQAKEWGVDELNIIQAWIEKKLNKKVFLSFCKAVLHLKECAAEQAKELFKMQDPGFFEEGKGMSCDFQTQSVLFGFFAFLDRLARDVLYVEQSKKCTLLEWRQFFLSRFTDDFFNEYSEDIPKEHNEAVLELLQQTLDESIGDIELTFSFVWSLYLDRISRDVTINKRTPGALHFSSLITQRCIPAKVIFLMGMDIESFPRSNDRGGMDLSYVYPHYFDYMPKINESERYLFLETLLSAKDKLFYSFTSKEASMDDSLSFASSCIKELFSYLDQSYTYLGRKASESMVYVHPCKEYDPIYFKEGPLRSSSFKRYELAQAGQTGIEDKQKSLELDPESREISQVHLHELLLLIKSPQEFFFKKSLQLRLNSSENLIVTETQDSILPNALENYFVDQRIWKDSSQEFEDKLSSAPFLMKGRLGELYLRQKRNEYKARSGFLKSLGIDRKRFFSLELASGYGDLNQIDQAWFAEPISVNGTQVLARLDLLNEKGNIFETKQRAIDPALTYIKHVLLSSCREVYSSLPISEHSFNWSPKESSEIKPIHDSLDKLGRLVQFISHCYSNFCPFPHTAWPGLINGDFKDFAKSYTYIEYRQAQNLWVNPYYAWSMGKVDLDHQAIFDQWSPILAHAFNGLREVKDANV